MASLIWPDGMRLFGWEATLGYGWSGSEPQPLEPAPAPPPADMELTPEKKETLSQVSLSLCFVSVAREDIETFSVLGLRNEGLCKDTCGMPFILGKYTECLACHVLPTLQSDPSSP